MSIKFAFSTVACPEWTLKEAAERAKEMGYHGLELRTLGPGGQGLASDPLLTTPAKVRDVLGTFGVEPVCLSTSVSLHHRDTSKLHEVKWRLTRDIETAGEIGCQFIRVFASHLSVGDDRNYMLQRVAEHVGPLAEKAGEHGVQLVFENAGSLAGGKPWWWLLNLIDHPMVGLCWNVANAAAAGESQSVSLPLLNSRISLLKLKDTRVGEGSGFVQLGDGTVGIPQAVRRALGLGYHGYITFEWDRLWLPSLAPAGDVLPEARERLANWVGEAAEGVEKAYKKPDQPGSWPRVASV